MPMNLPDGYDPVAKRTIPWAETPESAATREATTALAAATIPGMKAALQAAFDRQVTIARAAATAAEPVPAPGVTAGWLVVHHGEGPGSALPVAMLIDPDGTPHFEPTEDAQTITIVDDLTNPEEPTR